MSWLSWLVVHDLHCDEKHLIREDQAGVLVSVDEKHLEREDQAGGLVCVDQEGVSVSVDEKHLVRKDQTGVSFVVCVYKKRVCSLVCSSRGCVCM